MRWLFGQGCLQLSLTTRVWSVEFTWWKERTDPCKLSSDMYMCTLACVNIQRHIGTCMSTWRIHTQNKPTNLPNKQEPLTKDFWLSTTLNWVLEDSESPQSMARVLGFQRSFWLPSQLATCECQRRSALAVQIWTVSLNEITHKITSSLTKIRTCRQNSKTPLSFPNSLR